MRETTVVPAEPLSVLAKVLQQLCRQLADSAKLADQLK